MAVSFDYLQDSRTPLEYKQYFDAGIKNQKLAIGQLVREWSEKGYSIKVDWLDGNNQFQHNISGIRKYKPDCFLTITTPRKSIFKRTYEVKVSDKEPRYEIDIKAYQVEQLNKDHPGCYLFYSTPTRYFTVKMKDVARCPKIISQRVGDKECYRIYVPGLKKEWRTWVTPLSLINYPL